MHSNNLNSERNPLDNLPRQPSMNNLANVVNISEDVNHSSPPCFDIIVEDYVEGESLEDEEDEENADSNLEL
jgi:hypothetical protein